MFQTKLQRKSKHTFYVPKIFSEIRAVYEIMWKNTAERGRPQMAIWRMRIACWIPKSTDTHLHVIFHCTNGYTNAPRCYVIVHCRVRMCHFGRVGGIPSKLPKNCTNGPSTRDGISQPCVKFLCRVSLPGVKRSGLVMPTHPYLVPRLLSGRDW